MKQKIKNKIGSAGKVFYDLPPLEKKETSIVEKEDLVSQKDTTKDLYYQDEEGFGYRTSSPQGKSCLEKAVGIKMTRISKAKFQELPNRLEENIPKKKTFTASVDDKAKEAASLFEKGLTKREIARRMGINPSTVRYYINRK